MCSIIYEQRKAFQIFLVKVQAIITMTELHSEKDVKGIVNGIFGSFCFWKVHRV